MRADPADRIGIVEPQGAAPKISVPRIFGLSLILPFAHPIRLLLAGVLPAGVLTALILGPVSRLLEGWEQITAAFDAGAAGTATTVTPPPPLPATFLAASVEDFLWLYGGLLLAIALWLCFWQRAAARGFTEPIPRWFGFSLLRLPGYLVAFLVWALAPALVILPVWGALAWLLQFNIVLASPVAESTPFDFFPGYAVALSPLQWWAVGLTALLGALSALWLNARLLPLPALVARQGWRRSLGQAWGFSRGHGFGLSASLLGTALLMMSLLFIGLIAIGAAAVPNGDMRDIAFVLRFGGALDLVATFLLVLWQGSLGALVVRDSLAGEVDPALFD